MFNESVGSRWGVIRHGHFLLKSLFVGHIDGNFFQCFWRGKSFGECFRTTLKALLVRLAQFEMSRTFLLVDFAHEPWERQENELFEKLQRELLLWYSVTTERLMGDVSDSVCSFKSADRSANVGNDWHSTSKVSMADNHRDQFHRPHTVISLKTQSTRIFN